MLYSVCLACNREGHPPATCPFLHYNPDPHQVVMTYLQKQKELRQNFNRKPRRRFHAVSSQIKEIEQSVQKIRANHFIVHPAADNSIESTFNTNIEEIKQKMLQDPNLPECLALLTGNHSNIIEELFQYIQNNNQSRPLNLRHVASEGGVVHKKPKKKKQIQPEEFELDRVMIYSRYFVHNNVDRVLKKINSKLYYSKPFQALLTNLEGQYIFNPQNYI